MLLLQKRLISFIQKVCNEKEVLSRGTMVNKFIKLNLSQTRMELLVYHLDLRCRMPRQEITVRKKCGWIIKWMKWAFEQIFIQTKHGESFTLLQFGVAISSQNGQHRLAQRQTHTIRPPSRRARRALSRCWWGTSSASTTPSRAWATKHPRVMPHLSSLSWLHSGPVWWSKQYDVILSGILSVPFCDSQSGGLPGWLPLEYGFRVSVFTRSLALLWRFHESLMVFGSFGVL